MIPWFQRRGAQPVCRPKQDGELSKNDKQISKQKTNINKYPLCYFIFLCPTHAYVGYKCQKPS